MAGTVEGGKKAAAKNIARDPNFYAKIGSKGGRNGHTGGFAANPELARRAGAIGGRNSKRLPKLTLCKSCNCISKTIDGKCGKCGADKNDSTREA